METVCVLHAWLERGFRLNDQRSTPTTMITHQLRSEDLQAILQFTVSLARTAGKLILEGSEAIQSASANDVSEKKNSVDLVTEYDVRVEELVKKEIKGKYPEFNLWVVLVVELVETFCDRML
jgi:Inositol monophosphatase family